MTDPTHHVFNIDRLSLRQFVMQLNEADPLGGNLIESIDLIRDVGYVVVIKRIQNSPFIVEKLRSYERAHSWGVEQ